MTTSILKKQKAFTLIELMITVSILAIVMAVAFPNFRSTVANNRSLGAGGELVAALNLARAEAIKRSTRVTLCTTTTGDACLATSDWTKGWLLFVDDVATDTGTPVVTTSPTSKVIRYWKDLPSNMVATAVKTPSTAIHYVRFNSMGGLARAPNDSASRELNVSINQCRGKQQTKITVGIAGIVTSSLTNCP